MPEVATVERLKARAKIVAALRAFFDGQGFVEVETPIRIAAPAPEPHIDCPVVPSPTGGEPTYLRASPELQMKKLLAAGMDRIYQIGPCFREGERGSRHNPEFTMIEWYRRDADYLAILSDTENLFFTLSSLFSGDRPLNPQWKSGKVEEWKSKTIPPFHLSTFPPTTESLGDRPFKRVTVREAYRRWAGWDPWTEWDQDRFDLDMATKIEPALKSEGAVFLMDYPPQAASLARLRGDVAERWEFYIDGLELANCFTELCDPAEQRQRFEAARRERRQLGESDYPMDEEFLLSLGSIGSAAGVALGVDRLVMTLLGAPSIESVRCGL
jgi:lysyl-tRNA synthetase class 2